MSYITTQSGISWHYDCEGNGEPLIFLHGWGVDSRIWRQQTKFFSQFFQVLTIDLPGHGQSTWQKVPLAQMASDLKYILESLRLKHLTIVGSSLGGLFALKLYELFPQNIKRIIFVGSMPKFAKSQDYPYGLDLDQLRKLNRQLQTNYPSIINIFFHSLFTREERESRRFKWLQKFRRNDEAPIKEALAEYLDILEEEDLTEVLRSIQLPLQFINGKEDYICNRQTVAFLKTLTPRSRFDDFDQCGHFPFLSKPYEFNKILLEFLS